MSHSESRGGYQEQLSQIDSSHKDWLSKFKELPIVGKVLGWLGQGVETVGETAAKLSSETIETTGKLIFETQV